MEALASVMFAVWLVTRNRRPIRSVPFNTALFLFLPISALSLIAGFLSYDPTIAVDHMKLTVSLGQILLTMWPIATYFVVANTVHDTETINTIRKVIVVLALAVGRVDGCTGRVGLRRVEHEFRPAGLVVLLRRVPSRRDRRREKRACSSSLLHLSCTASSWERPFTTGTCSSPPGSSRVWGASYDGRCHTGRAGCLCRCRPARLQFADARLPSQSCSKGREQQSLGGSRRTRAVDSRRAGHLVAFTGAGCRTW